MFDRDLPTLRDVTPFAFRALPAPGRTLVPIESGADIPFPIARVFTINAKAGVIGGQHAHRRCSQLLICLEGAVEVVSRIDGSGQVRSDRLDRPHQGVLIPPGIWAEQRYLADPTVLMVLCDQGYDADDYVRDFAAFEAFRHRVPAIAAE